MVGGLKLGIWDEDGTDTLASTGKFHDITTSAGTNGDMKESGTAGEVNLRGESMKEVDRTFSWEGSSEGRIIWSGVFEYGGYSGSISGHETTAEI